MFTIEELRAKVSEAVRSYNETADPDARIERVSLFGSYADGRANASSDVDLLASFQSAIVSLITLAKVLDAMEAALDAPVDIVQEPIPEGSLLIIERKVPLYEGSSPGLGDALSVQ